MKELTIEEKAKAYDEIIEKANKMHHENCEACQMCIEELIPELAESEDERIRRELIDFLEYYRLNNVLDSKTIFLLTDSVAWLEKQSEQKLDGTFVNVDDVREDFVQEVYRVLDADSTNDRANQIIDAFDNLPTVTIEKQGGQKPADKVEPKFKAGDYVVIDGEVLHVKEVTEDGYLTDEGGLIPFRNEKEARLWTIQDAKDGDVLSYNDGHGNDCIDLIKSITDKKIEFWFCLTNGNRYEVFDGITPYTNLASREDATPATKEQRGLLFQKMHEAGYEWDAEKKELKKIEQKPTEWGEEDENLLKLSIENLTELKDRFGEEYGKVGDCIVLLESIRERVQPKQEWSEEDEQYLLVCRNALAKYQVSDKWDATIISRWLEDKLKSLRPQSQWRPSEEMLEALYRAIPENTMAISEDEMLLDKLYQGLKYGRVLSNK